jgi:hypothetical protein
MNEGKNKVGIIFNLDEHWKPGSHWVAMYGDLKKGEAYYFDSYGISPEPRVRKLMRRVVKIFSKYDTLMLPSLMLMAENLTALPVVSNNNLNSSEA